METLIPQSIIVSAEEYDLLVKMMDAPVRELPRLKALLRKTEKRQKAIALPEVTVREYYALMQAVQRYEMALVEDERTNGVYSGVLESVAEVTALCAKLRAARR